MPAHIKFDVASDLIVIHKVITRALDVAVDENASALEKRTARRAEYEGYIQYAECLLRQLHEHHSNEDTVVFPLLRRLLPDAPYDLLMSQHGEMIHVVEQVERAIKALKSGTHDAGLQAQLLGNLQDLRARWIEHIAVEEAHFGPDGISAAVSMADRVRIGKAASRYAQRHSNPIPLMLPFMLYNLAEQDRATLAQTMPGFLPRFFVPVLWRKRWAPMRPYLLVA
ncbi:MAG: hemerythrin domain-containing protein [Anaerolineae bacterium]